MFISIESEHPLKLFLGSHKIPIVFAVSLAQSGASPVNIGCGTLEVLTNASTLYPRAQLAERGTIARFKDGKPR